MQGRYIKALTALIDLDIVQLLERVESALQLRYLVRVLAGFIKKEEHTILPDEELTLFDLVNYEL